MTGYPLASLLKLALQRTQCQIMFAAKLVLSQSAKLQPELSKKRLLSDREAQV